MESENKPKSLTEYVEKMLLAPDHWIVVEMADNPDHFAQFISRHRRDPSGEFDHNDLTVVLDLPLNRLTPEQHAKAEEWFRGHGVEFATEEKCAVGGGKETRWFSAWKLDCGSEPKAAIEKMRQMMTAVYGVISGSINVWAGDFDD